MATVKTLNTKNRKSTTNGEYPVSHSVSGQTAEDILYDRQCRIYEYYATQEDRDFDSLIKELDKLIAASSL